MTLDKETHRDLLLQLINAATIPGNAIEIVLEIKTAIQNAELVTLAQKTVKGK